MLDSSHPTLFAFGRRMAIHMTTSMSPKQKNELDRAVDDLACELNFFRGPREPSDVFTTRLIRETRERFGEMRARIARLENNLDRIRNIVS